MTLNRPFDVWDIAQARIEIDKMDFDNRARFTALFDAFEAIEKHGSAAELEEQLEERGKEIFTLEDRIESLEEQLDQANAAVDRSRVKKASHAGV